MGWQLGSFAKRDFRTAAALPITSLTMHDRRGYTKSAYCNKKTKVAFATNSSEACGVAARVRLLRASFGPRLALRSSMLGSLSRPLSSSSCLSIAQAKFPDAVIDLEFGGRMRALTESRQNNSHVILTPAQSAASVAHAQRWGSGGLTQSTTSCALDLGGPAGLPKTSYDRHLENVTRARCGNFRVHCVADLVDRGVFILHDS